MSMQSDSRVYVAGHRGLVGSAIVRRLQNSGYSNLVVRTHSELDLTDQLAPKAVAEMRGEYKVAGKRAEVTSRNELQKVITELEKQMKEAAQNWEFEKAALLRDQLLELRQQLEAKDTRPEWEKLRETAG